MAYRYPEGQPVRYAFSFDMKAQGMERFRETSEGVIHVMNEGTFGDGFVRLRIRRQETSRKRVEIAKNRQSTDRSISDIYPHLSPNVIRQDPADVRFSFPVDACGRFAIREETPFHFLFYDSLCHFLPAFSRNPAAVGGTWKTYVPVILGFRYMNNEFTLNVENKLEKVLRLSDGRRAARVSFTFSGRFDTAEDPYAVRFSDAFRSEQRIVNEVMGGGEAVFDLDAGLVLWKRLTVKVVESRSREVIRELGEKDGRRLTRTDWEKDENRYEVNETWKLLP
ncbi:MAG TPA: hypothetical protein ENN09_00040 [Planctomycetes bacterium]|nr:hypothetical protein [Planctomycetota bacterium]